MEGSGRSRSLLASPAAEDASPVTSSSTPDSDFHSIMERHSLASSEQDQASPEHPSDTQDSQQQSSAGSQTHSGSGRALLSHASSIHSANHSSQAKASDAAPQAGSQTSQDSSAAIPAQAGDSSKTVLSGNLILFGAPAWAGQDPAPDAEAGAGKSDASQNDDSQAATDGSGNPSADGAGQLNASTLASTLVSQRANAINQNLFNLGAFADLKQRAGALSGQGDASQSSENAQVQALPAMEMADSQGGNATPQTSADGRSSAQNGNLADSAPGSADPRIEASTAAQANTTDPVAFEAKLSPVAGSAGGASNSGEQGSQSADQSASKQSALSAPDSANAPAINASAAKAETAVETTLAPAQTQTAAPAANPTHAPSAAGTPNPSAASRMEPLIEAPAPLQASHHSLTVKVPGASTDTGIDLRFVERGGDIHLSVRTPSPEVAQELRGGLSDLVGKLQNAGIRAEVSSPSSSDTQLANQSKDQSSSQEGSPDRRGGRNQSDSQNGQQQDSREHNQSRWIQAFENSASSQTQANSFSKEQNI